MKSQYQNYTTNDFLQDNQFLQWRLFPSETDHLFWKIFLEEHPSQEREINEAIRIINSLKLNKYLLTTEEKDLLLKSLKNSIAIQEKKKSKRLLYIAVTAAASILLICGFSFFSLSDTGADQKTGQTGQTEQTENSFKDSDIKLVLSDNETMAFDQDANIQYDKKGNIMVSNGNQQLASKTLEEKQVKWNKLIVPYGKRSSLYLSDGTKVWVNSGSVLEFPATFNSDMREIFVEGEIYIEVAKKEKQPFFVNTPDFKVEVLGTRFNVSAYKDDTNHSVVLVEGSVNISAPSTKKNIQLLPDHRADITSGNFRIEKVDVYDYISWKDGLLQFHSEPLSRILSQLSRYYDIPVECSPDLQKMKCTGKLVMFDDLDTVLQTIANTIQIKYTINNDKVIITR